jgi:hypothetical protein
MTGSRTVKLRSRKMQFPTSFELFVKYQFEYPLRRTRIYIGAK